jgi:hypothetical protein
MRRILVGALLLSTLTALYAQFRPRNTNSSRKWAQYEYEMQDPVEDPPDAWDAGEFVLGRLRYRSGRDGRGRGRGGYARWGIDANKGDRIFLSTIRRLTRIHTQSTEDIVDIDSDAMYDVPFLFGISVGDWQLSPSQAARLRTYFDRGGFLMVDDFHGSREWTVFVESMRRVFPDRPIVDLPNDDPIFHTFWDLEERQQIPGLQFVYSGRPFEQDGFEAHWRGIYDDEGRVMVAICHNMDLGDAVEHSDTREYPQELSAIAMRTFLNYIIYSMTH